MDERNIYVDVPHDAGLARDRVEVIGGLLLQHQGTFLTAKELAKMAGLPTRGTQVEVRKAATILLEIDRQPIVTNAKGFAITRDPGMVRKYLEHLIHRRRGLNRRIKAVDEILQGMTGNGAQQKMYCCSHCSKPTNRTTMVCAFCQYELDKIVVIPGGATNQEENLLSS